MTTVVKAQSAADFLALVPALAGYQPERSLVVVPFAGKRTIGLARYDQPTNEQGVDSAVNLIRSQVSGVDGVAVVAYTDTEPGAEDWITQSVELAVSLFEAAGIAARDALVVTPTRFWSIIDVDRRETPASHIDVAAERLGYAGFSARRNELPALEPMDDGQLAEFRRLLAAESETDWERYALDAGGWAGVGMATPLDLARIAFALKRVDLRDKLHSAIALGQVLNDEVVLARFVMGQYPTAPSASRLTDGANAMRRIAEVVDDYVIASTALTVAAWLYWAQGRGTFAGDLVGQALREDPENTYAELFNSFISLGVVPEWATQATTRNAVEALKAQGL
jgi:hypothetical protein